MSGTPDSASSSQPRSHGGCTTCKIRKVKCDETRPICRRCESTGRKCDGYQQIQSLRLSVLTNPRELRSYHYFWNRVLLLLPGHYDHLFWGIWVRQACFSDLAIQHAVIAVGAIHESVASQFTTNLDSATRLRCFAIQQYHKSIQYLNKNASGPMPIELILASCIVFITFENLCGRNDEAFKHLQSGLAILQSWKTMTASERLVKAEYLTPILTRGYGHNALADISLTFDGVQAARRCLQMLLDSIYSAIGSSTILGNRQRLTSDVASAHEILGEWYLNFAKLHQPRDLEQKRSKILLRLQFETASILIASISFENECDIDKYHDTFETIVSQCEQLVNLEGIMMETSSLNTKIFTYGFDLNILPPLNIVAFKCRDPILRRRAITLLGGSDRYEGLWSGRALAQIAQKTMETEEDGRPDITSCTDIPESSRVKLVGLSYSPSSELSTSRNTDPSSSNEAQYCLQWLRSTTDGKGTEFVDAYLPVSAKDASSPWGPGSHPWHMDLHYNSQWAQWKIADHPQDLLSDDADYIATFGLSEAAGQFGLGGTTHKPGSSTVDTGSSAHFQQRQHVNLFWDHWRLRTISVRHGHAVVVQLEKEATRGGRSYGDAKTTDNHGIRPSHLLISLP